MIQIDLNTSRIGDVAEKLDNLGVQLSSLEPLHRDIANSILNITEQSFVDEKDPWGEKWQARSAKTRARHEKILHGEPKLYKSFTINGTNDRAARVSTNMVYAAIHQFGGKAGKGKKVSIPKRSFFPVTAEGDLADVAIDAVLEAIDSHIEAGLKTR